MTALKTPLAHRLYARYGTGDDLLPIIGLDERDRPLVLTRRGDLVPARKTRVDGQSFSEVVMKP